MYKITFYLLMLSLVSQQCDEVVFRRASNALTAASVLDGVTTIRAEVVQYTFYSTIFFIWYDDDKRISEIFLK